ncbi:MAG TPA: right-handed parallel beta-helix repeat-containing protein [Planctomycetaceae bacterium]|jgi:hypothetical protein|nr:right-handed parallel beta-helix repeat-containing protein [Planctomycetaceae bacterium]
MNKRVSHSHQKIAAIALLLIVWLPDCSRAQSAAATKSGDFYVATNGRDSWSGSVSEPNADRTDGPFATLTRARNAVRELKKVSHKKDFVVRIRGGTYVLRETLVFSLDDSAPNGGTITYAASPGEKPILSSGVPIRSWRKLTENPPEVPATARGKLWVADLPPDFDRILTLYDGLERLPRARTKGFTPPEFVKPNQPLDQFRFPVGAMKNWPDLKEAELLVIPSCDYEMNILPIASVDERAGVAKTASAPSRPIGKVKYFDKTLWIENLLEALDEPGEWVFSAAERKIYLWPKGERPGEGIVAPGLTELIKVEGKIDYDGPQDQPVRGLVFQGLTFAHAERFPWHGYTGWSLQHSWEMFDRPTAAMRFRGASECAVVGCRFTATSGTGIRLDLTCQQNRIAGNAFSHLGAMAILLAGYGPGTKNTNDHNEVVNNWVRDTGEVYWATPAIMVWQSGNNHVANNLIHNTPYTGIAVNGRVSMGRGDPSGDASRAVRWREIGETKLSFDWSEWYDYEKFLHARENLVEKNEIHHVMESMGDGNGIYISGSGRANHIYHNFVHHCSGTHMGAGIRCDDVQNETIVEGNVIYRIHSVQVGISMTGRNHILNNIIADIRPSPRKMRPANIVHGYICVPGLYPYGPKNAKLDITGARIERNIIYSPRNDYLPVLEYRSFSTGPGDRLKGTYTDHNLYWCPTDPAWGQKYLDGQQPLGVENNSLCADPLFVDLEKGDLRLKPDSPAWKLGFQLIDLDSIGLLPNHPYCRPLEAN